MLIRCCLNEELHTEELLPERHMLDIGIKLKNKDECTVCLINQSAHCRVSLGEQHCHI